MRKYLRVLETTEGTTWDVYACTEHKPTIFIEKIVGHIWISGLNTYTARDQNGNATECGSLIFALTYFEQKHCSGILR